VPLTLNPPHLGSSQLPVTPRFRTHRAGDKVTHDRIVAVLRAPIGKSTRHVSRGRGVGVGLGLQHHVPALEALGAYGAAARACGYVVAQGEATEILREKTGGDSGEGECDASENQGIRHITQSMALYFVTIESQLNTTSVPEQEGDSLLCTAGPAHDHSHNNDNHYSMQLHPRTRNQQTKAGRQLGGPKGARWCATGTQAVLLPPSTRH